MRWGTYNFTDFAGLFDSNITKTIEAVNGNYVAKYELPGYAKEDIKITYNDDTIKISASNKDLGPKEHFLRVSGLGDTNNVKAIMKHGLLTITIPTDSTKNVGTIAVT